MIAAKNIYINEKYAYQRNATYAVIAFSTTNQVLLAVQRNIICFIRFTFGNELSLAWNIDELY